MAATDTVFIVRDNEDICVNCGCPLEPYEIFTCRLRGLETPVCLGCLANALVWLKRHMIPMLETALKLLGG